VAEPMPREIEEVINPTHLKIITEASGGFYFVPDPSLPPNRVGYTNKETGAICYNPRFHEGMPELGIPPWGYHQIRWFFYHEAGHHNPIVLMLDNAFIEDLGNTEIIPESYRGSPEAETRFFDGLYRHLMNGLVDVWLESFMGRRPFFPIRESIVEGNISLGQADDYRVLNKPEQLIQTLLKSRFEEIENLKEKVDPDVLEAFHHCWESGAMTTMMDRHDVENYFAAPADLERAIERKVAAYKEVFLPTYLKLLENELEKRKEECQKEKFDEMKQQQEGGKKGKKKGKGPHSAKASRGKRGAGQLLRKLLGRGGQQQPCPIDASAVPLTDEEIEEMKKQIIEELIEAGKQFAPLAPSEDETKRIKGKLADIESSLQEIERLLKAGKDLPPPGPMDPFGGLRGEEAIRALMEQLMRQHLMNEQRGLAESMKVSQESIRLWERAKEKYRQEIESMATAYAEIFLDDRRKRIEFGKREGEVTPGLEYETMAAYLSGEPNPDTHMRTVQNPEFLERETEWILDTSGSMNGDPLRRALEFIIAETEAQKRTREILQGEDLLTHEDEQPFRIGMTIFDVKPHRITKLDEPLNDEKEVKMIHKGSQVGGGTSETGTIDEVHKEMTLEKKNVIKIIVVVTDGHGDKSGVWPVLQQIEEDDEVIFLAVAISDEESDRQAILETYMAGLRKDREESNVFGIAHPTIEAAIPEITEFFRVQVEKRRPALF